MNEITPEEFARLFPNASASTVARNLRTLRGRLPAPEALPKQDSPSKPKVLAASGMSEMERKSEKVIQEQIANWLRQRNVWFCRNRMDRKTSNGLGTPDFLLAWPWKMGVEAIPIAVECKSATGKLTEDQERVRKEMLASGWRYFVIRSLLQLREELERL